MSNEQTLPNEIKTVEVDIEIIDIELEIDVIAQIIEIHVNEKPVKMRGKHHTGLDIKLTAIEQGVQITSDFVLYLEKAHGHTKEIADNESVKISDHSQFTAIPDDDNS